ncbi:hypothetical protein D3C84_1002990 [compost metagenome]
MPASAESSSNRRQVAGTRFVDALALLLQQGSGITDGRVGLDRQGHHPPQIQGLHVEISLRHLREQVVNRKVQRLALIARGSHIGLSGRSGYSGYRLGLRLD